MEYLHIGGYAETGAPGSITDDSYHRIEVARFLVNNPDSSSWTGQNVVDWFLDNMATYAWWAGPRNTMQMILNGRQHDKQGNSAGIESGENCREWETTVTGTDFGPASFDPIFRLVAKTSGSSKIQFVPSVAVLFERLHHDPVEFPMEIFSQAPYVDSPLVGDRGKAPAFKVLKRELGRGGSDLVRLLDRSADVAESAFTNVLTDCVRPNVGPDCDSSRR